jgi:hypothetical protein
MNKLDTLNKLNKIASVLENNGNVKEAEILTDVMIKLSQTAGANPFKGGADLNGNAALIMNQALNTAYLKHQQDNAQYARQPAGTRPTKSAAWDHIRAQKTKLDSIDPTAYPKLAQYFAQWAEKASKDKLNMPNRNLAAPGVTNTTNQTQNAEIANLVKKAVEVHNKTNNGWAWLKDQLHKHPTLSMNNKAMIEAKNQFYYATQPGTPNPTPGKPV